MSEGELLALYLAERLLRTLEGTPFEQDLRGAITKSGDMLPEGISVRLDERADLLAVLPASRPCYDVDAFRTLTSAIVGRRRLEMTYWTASRDEITHRVFDPYDLAVVEDGWYAVGHGHLRGEVRVFAVQRVRSVRQTGETFDRPADFRVEDYMQGSFRAVLGDGDHRIVLRFSPAVAGRVAERVCHPSQTIERLSDGGLVLTLHLSSLIEIKRWVLSWGAACEVIEPSELREVIHEELRDVFHRSGRRRTYASYDVG